MPKRRADYQPNEYFYDEYEAERDEARNEALSGNISNYRTKTTKCGRGYFPELIEVDVYPAMKWGVKREPPAGKTSEAQRKVNHRNVQRKVTQICNANFGAFDVFATLNYEDKHLPEDYAQANRKLANYFKCLKRLIDRINDIYWADRQISFLHGERERITREAYVQALSEYQRGKRLRANFAIIAGYVAQIIEKPIEALKYIYVTEHSQSGRTAGGRFHHHIITNFREREIFECFWKWGLRNNTRLVKPDDFGLAGLAFYITKDYAYKADYEKSYGFSRNLYLPYNHATTSNTKASKKKAAEIATDITKAYAWFAKHYPKYELLEAPEVRTNEYFGGYWIYARLRRREE